MSDIFERHGALEHDDVCRMERVSGVAGGVDPAALNQVVQALLIDNLILNLFQDVSQLALGIVEVHLSPQAEMLEGKAVVNAGSESLIGDRAREVLAVVAHY